MNRFRIRSCFYALVIAAFSPSLFAAPPKTASWTLTFDDEFNGTALDTSKWSPHDHFCGVRNNELQAYMPENISVANGLDRETCEKRAVNYGYCGQPSIAKDYASGMMITMDKFDQQFGYFECRCKIPKGKGYWPAFWLLPYNKWPPEIDILEILGDEPDKVYMTNHYLVNGVHQSTGGSWTGPDFSAGFHTFGVEWDSSKIVWYVDSVERFRSTDGIPAEPFFMLVNLALGGDWPGSPDSTTVFPGYFDIDWVRVYKKSGAQSVVTHSLPSQTKNKLAITLAGRTCVLHNHSGPGNIRIISANGKVIDDIFIPGNKSVTYAPKSRGIFLLLGNGMLSGIKGKIVF
ncbi:MAG TPA: glycoside hydrolase family 16 protein [Chitinivibrionales bacterium]|nr:glycoside hydrolase family 16 protein [Chitinivibrionales bacterium]